MIMANMYNSAGRVTSAENSAIEWQELAADSHKTAVMWCDAGQYEGARRWQEHAALDAQQARWNMGIE